MAKLYQNFPQATIITSSAVNGISHAEIQERELRALWSKWTVEQPETVMREELSNSSRTELAELIRLVVYKNLTGKVIVVTNDYHVPRVENTLKHLPQLMEKQDPSFAEIWQRFQERDDVSLEIQDAETVVRTVNPKFDAMLATVFEKEPWKSYRQTRLDAEKRGIEAIEQNAYDSQKIRRQ